MAFDFSVTGNTKLDTSGFTQGVSSMTVAAGTLIADLVKTASSQLTNLAQSAIRNGSVYETSLAKVGTIADLGKLSIQKLGSQITDMSNTMGIAATDIAEATYQAISAGQDTANAVEFAGQAAKLATAGFTSTTSAVDILTTTLNAYGLSADQATHVSDVLLTTQNLGKTSVDELSSSMGKVIPLAAAYNVSVENLSSGLAVMTANGIATAEATTYTKSMLNELGDTGSSVGKILQQQTGKSFAQLSADGKSLGDVLQVLYDSVGDDGTAFAGLWSSVEAGTGALSLVSGGADKFNGVLGQMVDSAGATETAYATMTDTFQHSMDSLQTTAENLSIDLFEAMEPGLKEAANWGTDCLNTLTSALNEGGPAAMLDAASGILENLTAGVVQKIPGLASAATQVITKLVQYLADHQDEIFDAGIQMLEQLIIGITDNLPQLITAAAELIAKLSAALISHLPDLLNCGAALLTTLVDGILRSIENLGEAALACIAKLTGVWDGSMDEWGHIGENIVTGLLNGITGMWDTLVSTVKGKVNGMVSTVKNVLGIHSPSKAFTEIGENVTQGLVNGINTGGPSGRAGHPEHRPDPQRLRPGFCHRRGHHHRAAPHQAHRGLGANPVRHPDGRAGGHRDAGNGPQGWRPREPGPVGCFLLLAGLHQGTADPDQQHCSGSPEPAGQRFERRVREPLSAGHGAGGAVRARRGQRHSRADRPERGHGRKPHPPRHLPHRDAGGCAVELLRQKQGCSQRFPVRLGGR